VANPSPRLARSTRWLALIISTIVAAVIVEIALRQAYPRLPSIDGLRGTQYRIEQLVDLAGEADSSLCHEVRSFLSHRSRWGQPGAASGVHFPALDTLELTPDGAVLNRGSFDGDVRSFWVSGDSLAFGLGVRPNETFGAHLAGRLAVDRDWGVTYRNLAVPGAGYCTAVQRVAGALKRHKPDLVLLVLSADDLEERLMLNVEGNLVALPDLVQDPVARWAVKRSWFANLIWFRWSSITEAAQGVQGRFVGRSTQAEFRQAMAGLNERVQQRGGQLIVALVGPPGLPMCTEKTARQRCDWLKEDMRTMLALLNEAEVVIADLRGMWTGLESDIVARERRVLASGRLAMHPSAEGHAKVAARLWPHLSRAR
jgi:lysophospholipase L1-like esterase